MALPHRRRVVLLGAGLVASVAFGACSASGGSSAASGGVAGSGVAPAGAEGGDAAGAAAGPGGAGQGVIGSGAPDQQGGAGPTADITGDKIVRTASLQVQVDDVEAKAAEARRIAVALGGSVTSENSSAVPVTSDGTVDKQGSRSVLVLAVPSESTDAVMDDLGRLGTVAERTSSSRDVTATYVDTQARVATMKAGVDQLRALLAKATELGQVVTLETEISRRQADLDAMQAQLTALDRKVALSTVTLTLTTTASVVVPADEGGFLGGLAAGWRGFVRTGAALLTVVGLLLPFLVALAVGGGPVLLWWRRRRSAEARRASESGGDGGPGGAGPTQPEEPDEPDTSAPRQPEPAGVA